MLCVKYPANPASKFQIAWGCFAKLGSFYFDILHFFPKLHIKCMIF